MDRSDLANVRRWHRIAAHRAVQAGFDIVYVYVGHSLTVFTDFLSPRINRRTDAYGGSIENRTRLLREVLDEVRDEVAGEKCAVAVRLCVDEQYGDDAITAEDGRATVEMLAEVPDLWDVNVGGHDDMLGSRFRKEGWQEPGVAFVKQVTTKPVVGVGRFTSPDTMVSMVRRGVLDFIGAARPSIADPFLPAKIEEGRPEDIRECIGCNVCPRVEHPHRAHPLHPEPDHDRGVAPRLAPREDRGTGLRCPRAGRRGAAPPAWRRRGRPGREATRWRSPRPAPGSAVISTRSRGCPGSREWIRVRDWRIGQLTSSRTSRSTSTASSTPHRCANSASSTWWSRPGRAGRRDGVGTENFRPVPGHDRPSVLTPDDVLAGAEVVSPVVLFDNDTYVVGGCVAEKLAREGHDVTLVTPFAQVSPWTQWTIELPHVQPPALSRRECASSPTTTWPPSTTARVEVAGVHGEPARTIDAATVVLVTMREPNDALYRALRDDRDALDAAGIRSLRAIGDCHAPGLLSEAVFSGHEAARLLDGPDVTDLPFRIEQVPASWDPPLPWTN